MLIRGISFRGAVSTLDYTGVDGSAELELRAGDWLRFSIREGPRLCLGILSISGPTTATHLPCPSARWAVQGYQCRTCLARDDFRLVHNFHRDAPDSRALPAGLSAYLSQEHWLYVATFADGATKVGTASARSKYSRLAEQGAVVASYVAVAQDGRIVRLLEDAVSSALGLTQRVRAAAKSAALLAPLPADEVAHINARHGAAVRKLLDSVELAGFRIVAQQWKRPELADALCRLPAGPRQTQRQVHSAGTVQLTNSSPAGSVVLAAETRSPVFALPGAAPPPLLSGRPGPALGPAKLGTW